MRKPDEIQLHTGKVRLTYRHPPLGEGKRGWLEHVQNMKRHAAPYGVVTNVVTHSTHTNVWVRF